MRRLVRRQDDYLTKRKFENIDINDPFFDSLKRDYSEFEDWFNRKRNAEAYLYYEGNQVEGFLYIKMEDGPVADISPNLECERALKIGTFKINPHGTKLGERFIKKALDFAIVNNAEFCYVTIFNKQQTLPLIVLMKRYGFYEYGTKDTPNGIELVLVKDLKVLTNDILIDYPLIKKQDTNKYLLAIYPQYHSIMFPDSILNTEDVDILEDISFTNSIHKIYVTTMPVNKTSRGDVLIMYRTATPGKKAEYTSVATSVCVVEEVRSQSEFEDFESFYSYASTYSVFDKDDLRYWYNKGGCYSIKMTYNAALSRRLIRKKLIEEIGIDRQRKLRWSFFRLTDDQFNQILEEGGVSESIIID
ncbi:N-acetyltransferase [Paenibacillus sp. NPDC056722]|uniref:N-acetyltransferase n=1 Tax=Paenibacillus sp. NPDC056722 TaxID=3345924 RepID=UPI0036C6973C